MTDEDCASHPTLRFCVDNVCRPCNPLTYEGCPAQTPSAKRPAIRSMSRMFGSGRLRRRAGLCGWSVQTCDPTDGSGCPAERNRCVADGDSYRCVGCLDESDCGGDEPLCIDEECQRCDPETNVGCGQDAPFCLETPSPECYACGLTEIVAPTHPNASSAHVRRACAVVGCMPAKFAWPMVPPVSRASLMLIVRRTNLCRGEGRQRSCTQCTEDSDCADRDSGRCVAGQCVAQTLTTMTAVRPKRLGVQMFRERQRVFNVEGRMIANIRKGNASLGSVKTAM